MIRDATSQVSHRKSLRLFMRRVFAAEAAVLVELDPLRRLLLVLRRAVVPALAVAARHVNDVSHCWILVGIRYQVSGIRYQVSGFRYQSCCYLLDDFRHRTRADRAAALANREARALLE